ncbi:MAG: autotransporter outer membrane beta-barrel domain-containing protein, partial [Rhodospirillaceae bacterium]|nr:autotransporter outer membrane beta-barrel domain-containing protein [Rhodospirillaceae bacterium]
GRLDLGDGDDAAVLLNDGVFGGSLANVETLRKLNPGTWTLTSDVAVTRTASVFDGGLRISGRLTAPQVQTFGRGTLSGAGTIQGSLVNDGVFAPDGGQQLRVAGDFHQTASGVFRFSPQAGATAPLAVDGAVMLDGTLALSGAAAALRPGGVFDLVAVTPGAPVTGRFARIDGLGPYFVTGALRRSADGRVIRLSIERQPYASAAQSPAQAAVGAALDAALARGSAGLQPIFDRLDRLSAAQAATDLDRLSPRTPVMAATAVEVALRTAQAAVGQWLELGPSDGVPGSFRVWGHAGRRTGTSRGDAGATFGMRIDHATAGLDYALPDGTRVGLALSGLDVGASLRAGGASIEAAPKLVAVTAGHAWPRWRMAGALMIGDANPSWRRDGLTGPNAARSDSDMAAAFATLTYAGNIGPFIVKPSATLHVSRVRADAAEESGGAALSTMADTRWSVRPEAGWRMVARPGPIHPYVGVAAAYEAGERDRDLTAMFRADPLAAFSLTGPAPRKLWLTVQAGANIELGPGVMARIGFDGVVNEPLAGRGFGAGLSYRW